MHSNTLVDLEHAEAGAPSIAELCDMAAAGLVPGPGYLLAGMRDAPDNDANATLRLNLSPWRSRLGRRRSGPAAAVSCALAPPSRP